MNNLNRLFCRTFQFAFRIAIPFLPYREPVLCSSVEELEQPLQQLNIGCALLVTDNFLRSSGATEKLEHIRKEDIPAMAKHAHREANPLYPVPRLMDAKELEQFYYMAADWS